LAENKLDFMITYLAVKPHSCTFPHPVLIVGSICNAWLPQASYSCGNFFFLHTASDQKPSRGGTRLHHICQWI